MDQSGLGSSLLPLGWVHDHHVLPDEPTIDHDCWSQFSFQRDNPWFLMMITGERAKKIRRPKSASPFFDTLNWFSTYSLTGKAMEIMHRISVDGCDKWTFRTRMGHSCPITDYVREIDSIDGWRFVCMADEDLSVVADPAYLTIDP